jgi:pyruvate kinase
MKDAYRHTKIVFTLGPASQEETMLEQFVRAGVDVCRLNMAHADHAWTRTMIQRVRAVCERVGRHIAILMDVKGPEIRTGDLAASVDLAAGQLIDLLPQPGEPEPGVLAVSVNYPGLGRDVHPGATMLVDSGLIRLEVIETSTARVRCRVTVPARLGNRRHINLPGVKVRLPALSVKDRAAYQMIRDAIRTGALAPGKTIIEHVSNSSIDHPLIHLPTIMGVDFSVTKHVLMLWLVAATSAAISGSSRHVHGGLR